MNKIRIQVITILALSIGSFGCVSVAEYQKVYLNDPDMELSSRGLEVFETNFEAYREGAAGGNGGKSGGGCGCN